MFAGHQLSDVAPTAVRPSRSGVVLHGISSSNPLVNLAAQYLRRRLRHAPAGHGLTQVWDEFYRRYTQRIRARIQAYRLSGADREDCFQEVWGEVLRVLPVFRDNGNHRAIDCLRRLSANREHPFSSMDVEDPMTNYEECSPLVQLIRIEDREKSVGLLAELRDATSHNNYRIFYARWIDQRTVAEIAIEMQLSPRQVTFRLARMLRKLRRHQKIFAQHARPCYG
jgi:DNA-directed RNA polymerase specialized sigma24 family protein